MLKVERMKRHILASFYETKVDPGLRNRIRKQHYIITKGTLIVFLT